MNYFKNFRLNIAFVQGEISISYENFFSAVAQFKSILLKIGIKPNNVIAVKGDNSIELVLAMYAVMESGAISLPVYHLSGKDEWEDMLIKANVDYAIFTHAFMPYNSDIHEINIKDFRFGVEKLNNLNPPFELNSLESEPRFIRFTSGTTGAAKGVLLSDKSIEDRINAANKVLKLGSNDTVLWVLPMAFHFVVSIMLYLRFGVKIVLANSSMPDDLINLSRVHNVSFIYLSPLHIKMLILAKVNNFPNSIKTVISTSSGVSSEDCKLFYHLYNIPVIQAYGIIELGLPIINSEKALEFPNSVGKSTPGYEIAILDDTLEELPLGEEGKLAISGVGFFEAYISPWKNSREMLHKGWFLTGDIAKMDSDGRVFVCGREKSMINLSGLKVFPEEIESVINLVDGVVSCRAYGVVSSNLQETLEVEVVRKFNSLTAGVIKKHCQDHLARYKIPSKVVFVEKITNTNSGKVKRL